MAESLMCTGMAVRYPVVMVVSIFMRWVTARGEDMS
jgi:hypothetical protein